MNLVERDEDLGALHRLLQGAADGNGCLVLLGEKRASAKRRYCNVFVVIAGPKRACFSDIATLSPRLAPLGRSLTSPTRN